MDIGSTLAGAPPSIAPPAPTRASEKETTQPVQTEEPRAKAVQADTAAEKASERRDEKQADADKRDLPGDTTLDDVSVAQKVDRLFEVEPDSETLIYKAVDSEDGDVVRQVPEDVILKLRATYNDNTPVEEEAPGAPREPIDRIA